MNKRIRSKVAKRENGGVAPAAKQHKAASKSTASKKPKSRSKQQPAGAVDRARAALGSVVGAAQARVENAVDAAQARVADKVAELKDKLHETEQQAEEALSKIPLVGAVAAKKLHDLTK